VGVYALIAQVGYFKKLVYLPRRAFLEDFRYNFIIRIPGMGKGENAEMRTFLNFYFRKMFWVGNLENNLDHIYEWY